MHSSGPSWENLCMSRNDFDKLRSFVQAEKTLTLATSDEQGEPHAASLFYWSDEQLSLYWLSSNKSRHSLHLAVRPQASLSIHANAASWREIRGLQMKGSVQIIDDDATRSAILTHYRAHFELGAIFSLPISRSTLYSFTPVWMRMTDNTHIFGSKTELELTHDGWQTVRSK